MEFFDLNMGCYKVALFVTLALVLQQYQYQATECNRRTTFIQVRIPQRTNVAIKYPKEINPVQFVPFPYIPSGSECIKCQGTTCNKCTYTQNSQHSQTSSTTTNARKTNIIIDIKGSRKVNESASGTPSKSNNNTSVTIDGTIVGIYDKTWAASKSGATAKSGGKGNSTAATASGTSLSQSDVLAALDVEETNKANGQKSNVEDIYAVSEDDSTAKANSVAISNNDNVNKNSKTNSSPSKIEPANADNDSTMNKPSGGTEGEDKNLNKDTSANTPVQDKKPAETTTSSDAQKSTSEDESTISGQPSTDKDTNIDQPSHKSGDDKGSVPPVGNSADTVAGDDAAALAGAKGATGTKTSDTD